MIFEPCKIFHAGSVIGTKLVFHPTNCPAECEKAFVSIIELIHALGGEPDTGQFFDCKLRVVSEPRDVFLDYKLPLPVEISSTTRPENLLEIYCDWLSSASARVDARCAEKDFSLGPEISIGSMFGGGLRIVQRLWYFEQHFMYVDRVCTGKEDFEYLRLCVEHFLYQQQERHEKFLLDLERLRAWRRD